MSDPIMQALAGAITWAQADLMYHSAFPPSRAIAYSGQAHAHGDARDDVQECHQCTDEAVDECECCTNVMCDDHRALCIECERYVCGECIDEDHTALCVSCASDGE